MDKNDTVHHLPVDGFGLCHHHRNALLGVVPTHARDLAVPHQIVGGTVLKQNFDSGGGF